MGVAVAERAGRVLALVARHGVLDTDQVAVLARVSRPTAHRILDTLTREGLLDRDRDRHGRGHRWLYVLSWDGAERLVRSWRAAGRQPPPRLLDRAHHPHMQRQINGFFVALARHAATADGSAGLAAWRHRIDTNQWLAEHGVPEPSCDGYGIWAEHDRAVRFLLLWWCGASADPVPDLTGVPIDTVLVVLPSDRRARRLFAETPPRPHGPVLACTTLRRLAADPAGPAGPVWATTPAEGHRDDDHAEQRRHRLIDLPTQPPAPHAPGGPNQ